MYLISNKAMEKSFLGKEKKPLPDEEIPRTPSPLRDKPLWLKDIYYNLDELENDTLDKLHGDEFFEEVDVSSWSMGTPPLREPSIEKILSEPMLEQRIPRYSTSIPSRTCSSSCSSFSTITTTNSS
ncbi:uncharacterized protein LOC143833050 [Paroedura picta]|uniref:uncharacterized protein LOC143833050 n=1 Tax=Paroedura picta TaxID=143630 RepID=UPI004057A1EE